MVCSSRSWTPALRAYVARLGDRAEQVRAGAVSPEEDNMLLISTDGRKAALDMRLVGGHPAPGSSKLDVAADTIAGVWREHRDRTYRDPGGDPSPNPGALQIVFCDLSTPTGPGWNAYRELRDQLAAREACPPSESGGSTRRATTPKRPGCSPPAAPARSP